MAKYVCNGAMLKCSKAMPPATATLIVIPPTVNSDKKQMANMMDFTPVTNVPTFGLCNSKINPAVVAATSAALGVHTPAPCIPALTTPWTGCKMNVLVRKAPAVLKSSKLMCTYLGQISVLFEGQASVKEG